VVSGVVSGGATGACANDYFPVLAGATWNYRVRRGSTTARARQTLESVEATGFAVILRSALGGERDVWICTSKGLAEVSRTQLSTREAPLAGTVDFHGAHSVGVTVPKNLYEGAAWSQTVTSHGDVERLGAHHPAIQTVTTSFRVVGSGAVVTPAGRFDALKIQVTSTTNRRTPSMGMNTTTVTRSVEWVARDVGVVMSVVRGPGLDVSTTLLAYSAA
jgi:hypothetical protein